MRRILVDHARKHHAEKRAAGKANLSLDESIGLLAYRARVELGGARRRPQGAGNLDPRQSRIVELKYFVGTTIEEITEHE